MGPMTPQQIATENLRRKLWQELGQISMELPEAKRRVEHLEKRDTELRMGIATLNAADTETAAVMTQMADAEKRAAQEEEDRKKAAAGPAAPQAEKGGKKDAALAKH